MIRQSIDIIGERVDALYNSGAHGCGLWISATRMERRKEDPYLRPERVEEVSICFGTLEDGERIARQMLFLIEGARGKQERDVIATGEKEPVTASMIADYTAEDNRAQPFDHAAEMDDDQS